MKPIGERRVIIKDIQVSNTEEFCESVKTELQKLVNKYINRFGEDKIKPNEISVFPLKINNYLLYASFKGDSDIKVELR